VGTQDNFFDLGGHSLLLVKVHSELRERLERSFSLIEIFKYPTVGALAKHLSSSQAEETGAEQFADRAKRQRQAMNRKKQMSMKRGL
jgi:hypothetical protein